MYKTYSKQTPIISSSSCIHPKKQRIEPPLNEDNGSKKTITGDMSQVLSLFKCCVCLDAISPPILQCRNAHVFCQSCRNYFVSPPKCPACREPLPEKDGRNHALEQIASYLELKFPCKYRLFGCETQTRLSDKSEHELSCHHRPYTCIEVGCKWTGDDRNLFVHLRDDHKYTYYENPFVYRVGGVGKWDSSWWRTLLLCGDTKFVFVLNKDTRLSDQTIIFKAFVVMIGEQTDANQFRYELKVTDQSDDNRIYFEGKPYTVRQEIRSIVSDGFGLVFDDPMAKRFVDDKDVLKVVINIKKFKPL